MTASPVPQVSTTLKQTMIITLKLPGPAAPKQSVKIFEHQIDERHYFSVDYRSDGTIFADVRHRTPDGSESLLSLASCPVFNPNGHDFQFGLSFDLAAGKISMIGNNALIGHFEPVPDLEKAYLVPPFIRQHEARDFSAANKEAIEERQRRIQTIPAKPGRTLRTQDEIFMRLNEEARQLQDLLQLARAGGDHHARGIAARLRLLVGERRYSSLLQTCAGFLGAPLLVFHSGTPGAELRRLDNYTIKVGITPSTFFVDGIPSATVDEHNLNPIDIDVWLEQTGAKVGSHLFTNRAMIKDAIGNTEASHFDAYKHPLVKALLDASSDFAPEGVTFLHSYIYGIGALSLHLANDLLALRSGHSLG